MQFCVICIFSLSPSLSVFLSFAVSLRDVEVSEGDSAALPCDLSLPASDDAVYLVLWFLDPHLKPIYT